MTTRAPARRDRVVDELMALGWATVRHAPEWFVSREFAAFADVAYARNGGTVRQLRANLRRVLPAGTTERALERAVRAGQRSYLRYWREVFRLPALTRDEVVGRMTVVDEARLRAAVASGRGVILALPHMGNWDHAGAWLVGTGVPFTTVAERLSPESLFARFVAFRKSLGMEVLPLSGGERPPYPLLAERLRAGGCLCLLADRDLTSTGVEVQFFGESARMPSGPARLALDTGAVLLPVTLWYPDDRNWAGRIHPTVEPPAGLDRTRQVVAMTQSVADAFAAGVAAHPTDWHMYQRIWVRDLDPGRLAVPVGATVG